MPINQPFFRQSWFDPKLSWNQDDYGNVSMVHFADTEVWIPDIHLYNSASGHNLDYYGSTQLLVKSNGKVLWVPPSLLTSYCSMNLLFWPYDHQCCRLKMGSWTYADDELHLEYESMDVELMVDNYEFDLLHTEGVRNVVNYECCPEPYSDVTFTFDVKRRSGIYRAVVVTPATIVILLSLACFWLPASSGEKILLNGVNVVVVVSFLLYFARRLPSMGSHTPYVGECVAGAFVLCVILIGPPFGCAMWQVVPQIITIN